MPKPTKQTMLLRSALRKAWLYLRQVTGDAAYENYVKYCAAARKSDSSSDPTAVMGRAEFYSETLKRKYSTINRCC